MEGDQDVPKYYDDVILPLNLCIPNINEGGLNLELLKDIFTLSPSEMDNKANASSNEEELPLQENIEEQKCTLCDYRGPVRGLQTHIRRRHLAKKRYQCLFCSCKSFRTAKKLDQHIKSRHHKEKKFMCPHCDYGSPLQSYLKSHIERVHKQVQLEFHLQTHSAKTEAPSRRCIYCSFGTETLTKLKHHIRVVHENRKEFNCYYCSFKTVYSSTFKKHLLNKHSTKSVHKCTSCQYLAACEKDLNRHFLVKHNLTSVTTSESARENNADTCSVTLMQESNSDLKFVPSNNKFNKNKSKTYNSLINKHTVLTKAVQGKLTNHKKESQSHTVSFLGSHNEETNQTCSRSTSQSKSIATVEVKAYSQSPSLCEDQLLLVQHMKAIQDGQTFYNCPFCQFRTLYMKDLTGQHTEEGIRQCPLCTFTTVRLNNMKSHIEAHLRKYIPEKSVGKHDEDFHSGEGLNFIECDKITSQPVTAECESPKGLLHCPLCSYRTSVQSKLRYHKQNHCRVTNQNLHQTMRNNSEKKKVLINCPKCHFLGEGHRILNIHIKTMHEDKPALSCAMCNFKTIHLTSLKLHIMSQHIQERSYLCEQCPYTTENKSELKKHILANHPMDKPQ